MVLASSRGLQNAYAAADFDYRFPEGLQDLFETSTVIALTTSDADELEVEVRVSEDFLHGAFDLELNQHLVLEEGDDLLVLSHASFTMICDHHGGDHAASPMPVDTVAGIAAGTYKVNVCVENQYDHEDADFLQSYKLIVSLMEVPEVRWENRVMDLSNS